MQHSSTLCVFLALLVGSAAAASASAESAAKTWLATHQPSDEGDLDALKTENPEAFAIVKALLTKRSLGLLNPRHPTASFAPGADASPDDAKPSGAAAFANVVSPGELKQAAPSADEVAEETPSVYADVPKTTGQKNWLNWKPTDSAAESDEAMVQNVLGAVAQLKGGSATKSLISKTREHSDGSGLDSDESLFDAPTDAQQQQDPKPAVVPASAQPSASGDTQNSYLKNIDLSSDLPQQQSPVSVAKPAMLSAVAQSSTSAGTQNSYLKDFDFNSDLKSSKASGVSTDSSTLTSFSWGDDSPKQQQKVAVSQEPKKKQNALSAYLR